MVLQCFLAELLLLMTSLIALLMTSLIGFLAELLLLMTSLIALLMTSLISLLAELLLLMTSLIALLMTSLIGLLAELLLPPLRRRQPEREPRSAHIRRRRRPNPCQRRRCNGGAARSAPRTGD